MNTQQKMRLFANQPRFLKGYLRKNVEEQIFCPQNLQHIYPEYANIERYKNLEQARHKVSQDKQIDTTVVSLIEKLHKVAAKIKDQQKKLQKQKKDTIDRFDIKTSAIEIDMNMNHLLKKLEKYQQFIGKISKQKKQIQKMIKITQIKNALIMQNRLLHQENQQLANKERQLDIELQQYQ